MPPRRLSREESWQSLHQSEASASNDEDGYTDVSMEDGFEPGDDTLQVQTPTFPTVSDVRKALHPLQATADRVGQQVEHFAKSLDRVTKKAQHAEHKDCRRAYPFIKEYQRITRETIKHLRQTHSSERGRGSHRRRKSKTGRPGADSPRDNPVGSNGLEEQRLTTFDDLKRWEEEEQTWDLLASMLQVEYPTPEDERNTLKTYLSDTISAVRPVKNTNLNGLSSEEEIWQNYLASDDLGWERHTVNEWLKRCADKSRPSIDVIVGELEAQAERGSGLWAHSWLFTKEAIKGQKRLRSWPQALEPTSPGLATSLVGSTQKTALVSQLDPDAISRQARELEKQDRLFEKAIWTACWEMIRRGKSWDYIRDWCQTRVELWRSTAMRSDLRFQTSATVEVRSRYLWRKACAFASKDGGMDQHEKALYGVLGGYLPGTLGVCQGWDDVIFAHYNSYLLHSFDRYLKINHTDRIPHLSGEVFQVSDFTSERALSGRQIVEKLKEHPKNQEEALTPVKMLQGALIARDFENFVFRQGVRITRTANSEKASKTIQPLSLDLLENSRTAAIGVEDYDMLRILTHMILLFYQMGHDFEGLNEQYAVDSILVAYIDFLSQAGKQQLIPLYASRLHGRRVIECMSRQLPFVLDMDERRIMLRLMIQNGIDVPGVLAEQLSVVIESNRVKASKGFPKLLILEEPKQGLANHPGIKAQFIGSDVSEEEYDLIQGLEWFMLVDGNWMWSMHYGREVYKYFMRRQRFAAARLLSQTVTFTQFSLSKTQDLIGSVVDLSRDFDLANGGSVTQTPTRHPKSPRAKGHRKQQSIADDETKLECEVLLSHGQGYLDFEHLFNAFDAIEKWKELASEAEHYTNRQQDSRAWSARKEPFTKAFSEVEQAVTRLKHGWMQISSSDEEALEFRQIRNTYLPEIILAYNLILNFSSRYISRNLLIKGMNLAAEVAAEGSEMGACFVEADRVQELVESMAAASKNLMLADGKGPRKSRGKRERGGETLGLWTVRAPEEN